MFTNLYIVDGLREMIRQTSDDSVFSDEFLYFNLNNARIQVMRQYLSANKKLSPWLYQRFCIKLCPSTFIECNCEPFDVGCTIWRSQLPIPKPLTTDTGYVADFSELKGELITPVSENSSRFIKYRRVPRNMHYLIGDVNGEKYLFIISNVKPPKYIKVNTILEDPTKAAYFKCEDEECFEPSGTGFPVEGHLLNFVYKIALEMLSVYMTMKDDRSNNSTGELMGFKPPRGEE